MTSEPPAGAGGEPPQWEELLRSMFGADADEAMRELRARGMDPAAMAAAAGLPADPASLGHVLAQVQRLLAASGDGPVNWDVAHDVARQAAAMEGDPSLTRSQVRAVTEALSVAELWLDAATDLPPAGGGAKAWSRSEWVEHTLPTWRTLAEPVAGSLAEALATAIGSQLTDGLGDDGGGGAGLPGGLGLPGVSGCPAVSAASIPPSCCASSAPRCSACRSGRPRGRSRARRSARPTSGCRCCASRRRCCCPPTSRRSPRGSTPRPRRSACSSRCARPPTRACSRTSPGCAGTCWASSARTRAASRSTSTAWRRRCARSTRPTRPPSRRRCPGACSHRTPRPSRPPRWGGWRRRSHWSRAGWTR